MSKLIENFRVLISSPGDVYKERDLCNDVIQELNRTVCPRYSVRLECVRWETHCTPGVGTGVQSVVNKQIGPTDIYVGIMWKRFGTPTKRASSGTEEEFNIAYRTWRETQDLKIMFYFRKSGFYPEDEDLKQFKKVRAFQKRAKSSGVFYAEYKDPTAFAAQLREHLIRVVINWHPAQDVSVTRRSSRSRKRHVKSRRVQEILTRNDTTSLTSNIDRLRRSQPLISLVLIDIDRFKRLTTNLGTETADQYLAIAAQLMDNITGKRGKMFRIGGDEFGILLPNFDVMEAAAVGERIRTAIDESELGRTATSPRLTVSVGVACTRGVESVITSGTRLLD